MKKLQKSCHCGSFQFYAIQVIHKSVIVDQDGNVIRTNIDDVIRTDIEGPYLCTDCNQEYISLKV